MLLVEQLTKSFPSVKGRGGLKVLDDIGFSVAAGAFFTLLGPSGCGKTTTMRSIAGLEVPDGGRIAIGGIDVFDAAAGLCVPPNKRQIGMVFQSYAIWPHMNVFANVAFPLRVTRRLGRPEIAKRVRRALETVQLGALADRPATQLSGGQQQRLALARALVVEPDLLLLDEPLSNLDAQLRDTMRSELRRLQRDVGVTTIFVTHDQTEALTMSDQVAVMDRGAVVQIGDPKTIYEQPRNRFVASFIGSTNLIPARAVGEGMAETDFGLMPCRFGDQIERGAAGMLSIRPEAIVVAAGNGQCTGLEGRVRERTYAGDIVEYIVAVGDVTLRVRGTPHEDFVSGDAVRLVMRPGDCVLLP